MRCNASRGFSGEDHPAVCGAQGVCVDGILGQGEPADLGGAEDQVAGGVAEVGLAHQRRADQKAVHQWAQALHIPMAADARLGNDDLAALEARGQPLGHAQIHGQGSQVTVVDPDDPRLQGLGPGQLLLVVHFGDHIQAQGVGHAPALLVLVVGQDGEHEEHGVRAVQARLVDLIGAQDEVLAEHRLVCALAYAAEVLERAAEEPLVGQDRDAVGVGAVGRRHGVEVQVTADLSLRGRGVLALQDESGAGSSERPLQAPVRGRQRSLEACQRVGLLPRGHFDALVGQDLVKRHGSARSTG